LASGLCFLLGLNCVGGVGGDKDRMQQIEIIGEVI
jgi:hypothetical protein